MKTLKELKKKYEELGKEIERLEKQKENTRWRAKNEEDYYFIDEEGEIISIYENNDIIDEYNYKTRNYFKTEKEAQRHLDYLNTYYELMDLAEELNNGEKVDWTDIDQCKYYIYYGFIKGLKLDSAHISKDLGQIYCLDENFLIIALERIGKKRLEELFKEEK